MTTLLRRSIVLCVVVATVTASCNSSSEGNASPSTDASPTTEPTETTEPAAPVTTETTTTEATTTSTTTTTTSTTTTTTTTSLAPRDPALLYLPVPPTVGETARQVVTSGNQLTLDAPGEAEDSSTSSNTTITADREIVEVTDGYYRIAETIVDGSFTAEGTDADPETSESVSAAFAEIAGTTVETTIGFDGVELDREIVDGDDLSDIAVAILSTPGGTPTFDYDTDGLAVGDTWTAELSVAEFGAPVTVIYLFELVSFDGTLYEISITVDQDLSTAFDVPADVAMTGSGSVTGDIRNSLLTSTELEIRIAGTIDDPASGSGTIDVTNTTSTISTPL